MARLVIGIIVGIILSFISYSLFTAWIPFLAFLNSVQSDVMGSIVILLGYNFEYNFLDIIMGNVSLTITNIVATGLLAWIFTGILAGGIAKGVKRGLMASVIVLVVVLLVWILLSVLAGVDLMSLFQGSQLITTLGGIIGAAIGSMLGGLIGGLCSGPYEEFY